MKLLVELLNFSLLNDVAGKVTSSLAMELDKRLKKSLLGDENYKLGDATKRTIGNAVATYTGKGTIFYWHDYMLVSCITVHTFNLTHSKLSTSLPQTRTNLGM